MKQAKFFCECYSDKQFLSILLNYLNFHSFKVEHCSNRPKLIKKIINENSPLIAIMDEDEIGLNDLYNRKLKEFSIIKEFEVLKLKIFKHKGKEQYIIILINNIEAVILHLYKILNINLQKMRLPQTENQLHDFSNEKTSKKLISFY